VPAIVPLEEIKLNPVKEVVAPNNPLKTLHIPLESGSKVFDCKIVSSVTKGLYTFASADADSALLKTMIGVLVPPVVLPALKELPPASAL
jgi:hypothetical protein